MRPARPAAVLETTLAGMAFDVSGPRLFVVTGAECVVTVADRAVAFAEPVLARAGARVLVGRATRGVRSYVAVAGGLAVDAVLGSRSTDLSLIHI